MVKGRSITFKYKHFNYADDVKKLLAVDLTPKEERYLNKIYECYSSLGVNRGYEYIIKDLFILVIKRNISTSSLAAIYNVGVRTIQMWLKELGLNRTLKEAKQAAVVKERILSNESSNPLAVDSKMAHSIKHQLNISLADRLKDCDVIVGVSALGITNEVSDIPVIIIRGSHIYKYIIETEETNEDKEKIRICYTKGYKLLKISANDFINNSKRIIDEIIKEMKGF